MPLISCPECNQQVSTSADVCPHCGYPLKKETSNVQPTKPIEYENKTTRVTCWGLGGSNAIIEKLSDELSHGWEIVSIVEDHWRGGALRHVYTVILKRPKKRG